MHVRETFLRRSALKAASAGVLWAGGASSAYASGPDDASQAFLWLAVVLVAAKLGNLVERIRQPAVLGEILVGVVLGSLALVGLPSPHGSPAEPFIEILAQLGAVILLFQIGLESDIHSMRKVGVRSFWVAMIGVAVPFLLGTVLIGPLILPGLSTSAYLFLGAALTATSVGITGRVFRDMRCISRPEAQIVMGAAVIDDVLGLIILSVVSAIATRGTVGAADIGWVTLQALGFLVGALAVGHIAARHLSRLFARIDRRPGTMVTVALGICLVFAYLASALGLAPIVGAFAAGLILDEVHFRHFDQPRAHHELEVAIEGADAQTQRKVRVVLQRHADKHLEQLLEPVGHFLVPVFFVVAGMQVHVEHLADGRILLLSVALTLAAIAGKLVSGLVAGKVDRWLVGWGMVPRGEVGLIFAFVGKSIGVVTDELFSVIVLMVMFTTLVTPPVLGALLRRGARRKEIPAAAEADALDRAG
jgi:Kef-type K+ transport system membrane component KefB